MPLFSTCMNPVKSFNISMMARKVLIFMAMAIATVGADAASVRGVSTASRTTRPTVKTQTANPTSSYTYNYMYPYLNNKMKTTLQPTDATSPSTSPINAVVRTEQLSAPRRVVPRTAQQANNVGTVTTTARAAATPNTNRRVVARAGVSTNNTQQRAVVSRKRPVADTDDSSRLETTYLYRSATNAADGSVDIQSISSARCLADYTECMDRYCVREDTQYNRCFCSAKLSQIDATYQPALESLIKQIIELKNGGSPWSDEEMNEYWMEKIGKYTGDNSWQKIDDLLNIDWASTENRTRGQNAFVTGHDYCVQHLRGCFYLASNLRDAYRANINTDCTTYETSLQRLKDAAESVIEAYKE